MIESEVIIIGGGPAGSSCAWKLLQAGKEAIILDKKPFPREKLCAGWITPEVLKDLEIEPENYPLNLTTFNRMHFSFYGIPVTMKTRQYAIRRYEFDTWLLKRSGVITYRHTVKHIAKENDYYVVDNRYKCKYLVGAGGTFCPVYRNLFKKQHARKPKSYIVTIEKEFKYDHNNADCYLWFFDKGFPGYSWYVPKNDQYLNIGIGGTFSSMKTKTILDYWKIYIKKLQGLSLLNRMELAPSGYNYYIRQQTKHVQDGNAFIAGDAAGLATRDLAEGIGPAVRSGKLAAQAIITGTAYSLASVPRYSASRILYYLRNFF